jgi:transposase
MDYHQNARLPIHSREQLARKVLVERRTLKLATASFNVSAKTAAKWVRRYQQEGLQVCGPSAHGCSAVLGPHLPPL